MAMTKLVLLALVAVACVSASYRAPVNTHYPRQQSHYRAPVPVYHAPKPVQQQYYTYAWSHWGYYGQCSKPCGGGVQYRTRTCERTQHYGYRSGSHSTQCYGPSSSQRRCNLQCCPVNGGWGQWSVWSNSHHGSYQQTRYRSCNYPRPSCGGQQCYGESTQTKNLPKPVHYNPPTHYKQQQPHYRQPHNPHNRY